MTLTPGGDAEYRSLTIREIVDSQADALELELLTPDDALDRRAGNPDIASPGLALAGFIDRVAEGRMWVFGETEMTYLRSLGPEEAAARLGTLFRFDVPAIFVTKYQTVPDFFVRIAAEHGIPVLCSHLGTKDFYARVKPFLEAVMAPATQLHGSLADVYGVGLLFVGESGVGKSECVLDLVERGHRLVADDLVLVSRRGNDVLIGRHHELQRHHMEIRGVGIIDIAALFGVRAIRQQKRIEVVVQLELWNHERTYSRTGLEEDTHEILGVEIPRVTVPLNPGKNITVISEVVAMNHLLRYSGIHSAADFNRRLKSAMAPHERYLIQDYE